MKNKRNNKWAIQEIEILKEYPKKKISELIKILKRSRNSVKGKLVSLGLFGKGKNSSFNIGQKIKKCKCGCGKWITFKGYNFYKDVVDYISGHNPVDRISLIKKSIIARKDNEGYKKKKSELMKINWSNESFRNKRVREVMRGLRKRPTKPESILNEIISKNNLPFNYVGDGQIMINGFNPDFISKNPKHIIEVNGDYWHNLPNIIEKDKRKLKTYSRYGYKTLTIWEHEIVGKNKLSDEKIVKKILRFIK